MLHQANIIIHVLAGILAMLIAIVPYASQKGGATHNRYGRIFLYLMAVVIITALNGVIFFRDRPFLTVVTMQSFYLAYSGYRVLKTKTTGFTTMDFSVMVIVLFSLLLFLWDFRNANILWSPVIVYYLCGYLILILAFDILRYFVPGLIKYKRFWIYEHIWKISGAFGALVSAGAGTVFAQYEPWNQIVPAAFTTWWLIFCLFYFPRKVPSKKAV